MIIFPAIDLRRGRCVRLRQGRAEDETIYDAEPADAARRWVAQGAHWLHVVNLDGAFGEVSDAQSLPINLQRLREIRRVAPETSIQFGGGVRSLADIAQALSLGATRVVLGTVAVRDPALVTKAVDKFGAARIVVGIDAHDGMVATHGWCETTDVHAAELGQEMRRRGVTRVVYTDIARDGMLTGVNVAATAELSRAAGLYVIASGGVATVADIVRLKDAARDAHIEGVIIGQALYTGAVSLPEALRVAGE